jgi:hypothetical protein
MEPVVRSPYTAAFVRSYFMLIKLLLPVPSDLNPALAGSGCLCRNIPGLPRRHLSWLIELMTAFFIFCILFKVLKSHLTGISYSAP